MDKRRFVKSITWSNRQIKYKDKAVASLVSLGELSGRLRIGEIATKRTNECTVRRTYIIKRNKKKDEERAARRILLLLPLLRANERTSEKKESKSSERLERCNERKGRGEAGEGERERLERPFLS